MAITETPAAITTSRSTATFPRWRPRTRKLVEYFDNFAFDEVLQHGSLDVGTRLIVQLAALIAGQACEAPVRPSGSPATSASKPPPDTAARATTTLVSD